MDVEQFKDDVRQGRIPADRLVDLVVRQQQELQAAKTRIEQLEKQLGASPTPRLDQSYSLDAEARRQEDRQREAAGKKKRRKPQKSKRRGRLRSADKIKMAQRTETVYPNDVPKSECTLSHTRPVWRIENGQAVLIAYEIYRGPGNRYGQIPGVLGRCEFGLEIVVSIAFQVYVLGLSFDKACQLTSFFQNLKLTKSQADSLLHRLSRHWEKEFDALVTLLAHSLIVHADETSWSIKSVWAFLSEKARVLLFGVHKDAATLEQILNPAEFAGLLISDDAAVYGNFTNSQKCWAHLLRKAIKLTLQDPDNGEYRQFTDRLLEIYREACRTQRDGRLGDAGRARMVAGLDDDILELCEAAWGEELPPCKGPLNDYRLLVNELMRLMLGQQLFTFVTTPPAMQPNGVTMPASGTNNEAERTLRSPAEARTARRTSKTTGGARRTTVCTSVFQSLRLHLSTYTLASVLQEVQSWTRTGASCFTRLLKKLKLRLPSTSVLDSLLPAPGG